LRDRNGTGLVLDKIRRRFHRLDMIRADGGYNARQVDVAVAKVKRRDDPPQLRVKLPCGVPASICGAFTPKVGRQEPP